MDEDRPNTKKFILSILCGIGATYSSGGGILVWPCLIAMMISRPISQSRKWSQGFNHIGEYIKSQPYKFFIIFFVSILIPFAYLNDFPLNSSASVESCLSISEKIKNGILFFFAFLGGIVPVYPIALLIGLFIFPLLVFMTIRYPRLRHPGIYWFMIIEITTMLSAAFFRSGNPQTAVSSRYCIVSCSVFASLLFLCTEQLPLSPKNLKRCTTTIASGLILYTLVFLFIGAPLYAKRNEIMRLNILTWPNTTMGLRSNNHVENSKYLLQCVNRGVYNPQTNIKSGEIPLKEPLPWLR
jgi:hypothetical protein